MLELVDDVKVVGDYSSAEEAFLEISSDRPDVVLMDAQMPGMSGIEATEHLTRNGTSCDANVVILSETSDYMHAALEAGADAFLTKDVKCAELIDTIKQVNKQSRKRKHLVEENSKGDVYDTLEVTLPIADAEQILKFTTQVQEILHANILKTVGCSNGGTAVTMRLDPTPLTNLMEGIMEIPGVANVQKRKSVFGNLSQKISPFRKLTANAGNRLQVTLKEPTAMRKLAATLN